MSDNSQQPNELTEQDLSPAIEADFEKRLKNTSSVKNPKYNHKISDQEWESRQKNKTRHIAKVYDLRIYFAWIAMSLVIICTTLLFVILFAQGMQCISMQTIRAILYVGIGAIIGFSAGSILDEMPLFDKNKPCKYILSIFLAGVGLIVSLKKNHEGVYPFYLDVSVLKTVIISFIVNIIGLLSIVFLVAVS